MSKSRIPFIVVLASMVAVAAPAAAQQAGRVINPLMNIANPDLVSYETLSESRQELMFYRKSDSSTFQALPTRPEPGRIMLPGVTEGNNISAFSGDMDWYPIPVKNPVRHWFTYVASERGALRVFANFIDSKGDVAADPLRLPIPGTGRQPRWSPDGKHLAFVSDSNVLYVFFDIDRAIQSRNVSALRATRIGAAGSGVLFPAWSPRSDHLAYQAERVVGGSRRIQVEVINIDTAAKAANGNPVVLTRDLGDIRAYHPSWSKDGRYVAYYMERLGRTAESEGGAFDIGVVQAQAQGGSGRVVMGLEVSGLSRRLAEGVVQNLRRGPSWTLTTVTGGAPETAIVYALKDDANGSPIYVHSLNRWIAKSGKERERVPISGPWRTLNHHDVTAIEGRGALLYVYASAAGGGEKLSLQTDPNSSWAQGNPVVYTERTVVDIETGGVVRGASVPKAVLFPGFGQLSGGYKKRGTVYAVVGLAGASMLAIGTTGRSSAASDATAALAAGRNYKAYTTAVSSYNSSKSTQMAGAGTLGAIWAIALVDAIMHKDDRDRQVRNRSAALPIARPSSLPGVTNLGVSLPFEFTRH